MYASENDSICLRKWFYMPRKMVLFLIELADYASENIKKNDSNDDNASEKKDFGQIWR